MTAFVTGSDSTPTQTRARGCLCLNLSAVLGYAEYLLMPLRPARSASIGTDVGGLEGNQRQPCNGVLICARSAARLLARNDTDTSSVATSSMRNPLPGRSQIRPPPRRERSFVAPCAEQQNPVAASTRRRHHARFRTRFRTSPRSAPVVLSLRRLLRLSQSTARPLTSCIQNFGALLPSRREVLQ